MSRYANALSSADATSSSKSIAPSGVSPAPAAITCSNPTRSTNCSASGHSTLSTTSTRSPACDAMYVLSSGWRRRFIVCVTKPARGRADVRLEVLVVVPHERRDTVAVLEAERAQRDRQALRPRGELAVAVAVPALVREPRDDLAVAVELVAAAKDRRHVQLVVHHQALHRKPPSRSENPQKRILAARSPPPPGHTPKGAGFAVAMPLIRREARSRSRPGAAPKTPPRSGCRGRACTAGAARAPT